MDARDLLRSVRMAGSAQGWRSARSAWRRQRIDARDLPDAARSGERARVPGAALEAEPMPGGGTVRFARSALRVRVGVGGAVFCGWDGAEPEPSYAVAGTPKWGSPRERPTGGAPRPIRGRCSNPTPTAGGWSPSG